MRTESIPNGTRHEWIDGMLHVQSTPTPRHQLVVGDIYRQIADELESRNDTVFVGPIDVEFTPNDVLVPDIVVVRDSNHSIITAKRLIGLPDLIIEVTSTETDWYDRAQKFGLYEREAVPEYWVVDPEKRVIEHFIHDDTRYLRRESDGPFTTSIRVHGLTVDLERVFRQ